MMATKNENKTMHRPHNKPHKGHDLFFKFALENPRVRWELLKRHIPKKLLAMIDMDSTKIENNTFIDEYLRQSATDVLISVRMKKSGARCYFYFLIEHTTNPDKMLPFRSVRYIIRAMVGHLNTYKTQTLPIIYPVIIYGGNKPYHYSIDLFDLFGDNKALAKEIYANPPQFIDLHKIDDEELLKHPYSGLMEYVLKKIKARDFTPYLKVIRPLIKVVEKDGYFDYIQAIFVYTLNKGQAADREAFKAQFLKQLDSKTEDKIMTMMEEIQQENQEIGRMQGQKEGVQIGLTQGIAKEKREIARNMLREGLAVNTITKLTGLSVAEIEILAGETV